MPRAGSVTENARTDGYGMLWYAISEPRDALGRCIIRLSCESPRRAPGRALGRAPGGPGAIAPRSPARPPLAAAPTLVNFSKPFSKPGLGRVSKNRRFFEENAEIGGFSRKNTPNSAFFGWEYPYPRGCRRGWGPWARAHGPGAHGPRARGPGPGGPGPGPRFFCSFSFFSFLGLRGRDMHAARPDDGEQQDG